MEVTVAEVEMAEMVVMVPMFMFISQMIVGFFKTKFIFKTTVDAVVMADVVATQDAEAERVKAEKDQGMTGITDIAVQEDIAGKMVVKAKSFMTVGSSLIERILYFWATRAYVSIHSI